MTQPPPAEPGNVTPPAAPANVEFEPRRRLHPLTPLLRGAKLATLAIAAISWQGYENLGTEGWLVAVGGVLILVLAGSIVSWLVTGYQVMGRELRVYEGFVWRRTRAIPLERLQSVELVRPLLARLFGLAELRLEVVGASKTEAPLAFLEVSDATALRSRLLATARRTGPPADPQHLAGPALAAAGVGGVAPPVVPAQVERSVHLVANRDLVISQLLRPQWWALPVAIAAPILFFTTGNELSFIAFASTATAVIGAIQAPVRVLLADWRFRIGVGEEGLRMRRGLLETRSQTVPAGRVQAVGVHWPLLWRGLGWVRANIQVAGVNTEQGGGTRGGTLLPVGTVPVAERVVAEAVPGFALTSVAVRAVPPRARWIVPLRRRVLGYQLADAAFVTRGGLLTRQLVVVPYSRIQSVRIRQGPIQRQLRLASVWVDIAGSGLDAVALHRDTAEALWLGTELAERSRAARRAAAPALRDQSMIIRS